MRLNLLLKIASFLRRWCEGVAYFALPQGLCGVEFGFGSQKVEMYSCSTLLRAHGVLRKNFNVDFTEGSFLKQFKRIFSARLSQP